MAYIVVPEPIIRTQPDATGEFLGGGSVQPPMVAAATALVAEVMTIAMGAFTDPARCTRCCRTVAVLFVIYLAIDPIGNCSPSRTARRVGWVASGHDQPAGSLPASLEDSAHWDELECVTTTS